MTIPRFLFAALAVSLGALSGCAGLTPDTVNLEAMSCEDRLSYVDAVVDDNAVQSASASPVVGYPFLRANRNSVLMARQLDADGDGKVDRADQWDALILQMRGLDRAARQSEIANLPASSGISYETVENCANAMLASLTPDQYQTLLPAVFVPDDYLDFQRIAGLYPLTAFPAYFGYEGWKQENFASFAASDNNLIHSGAWREYTVASSEPGRFDVVDIDQDAFGQWRPSEDELENLAQAYAPVFRVRAGSDSDKVGRPTLLARGALATIDTNIPTVYYRLSHTYFAGHWRPQIVYEIWFPERSPSSPFDILAGHLDALIWRVTLDDDGSPLIADTIHGCGCYHMFFPSDGLQRISAPEDHDIRETAEMPAGYLASSILNGPVLWIDKTSHYLLDVTGAAMGQSDADIARQTAVLRPAQELGHLLLLSGQGTASLFDEDGFVPGTERLERFILWPMGVDKPGAMRQWGHHATAFVGRRHFDEAKLMDRYFIKR
ncbi:hypothetical protein [Thalassospira sp. UBA1131]|uniref:hypothetical protein n=1 Tax=Thalassospira sp. UBA1131 TaxID=1947672 RepID=UPI0025D73BAC|nr:hypothetical protein [Thalassospira sp. UBA1131]